MKRRVPDVGELLGRLARSASWWRGFFESSEADEIDQTISELSPLDLAELDYRVREWIAFGYQDHHGWGRLRPSVVSRFAKSRSAISLLGLASFHGNGYVREAAVAELASWRTGRELTFLLIRLNDWVSQVREAAETAVRSRVEPSYAVHLLANISLIVHLRVCGRVDRRLADDVCNLLKRAECREVLQSGMASNDKVIRRTSFQLAAESDPSARASLVRALMTDTDGAARLWAVRHFLPSATPEELAGVIEPMLHDRFMPVRREALCALASKQPDLAAEALRRALLDSHVSMREAARYFLKVAGAPDARSFYIEAVERGKVAEQYAAICGLGETGGAADVPRVLHRLASPVTKIRRAAVYAMGKLDAEGCITRLVEFVGDAQPSVSRAAQRALLPKAGSIPLERLESLFNDVAFHVRRNALTLILHAGKWSKLPTMLTACADADAKIAGSASTALREWLSNYNRSYVEPTRADFERIQSALAKVECTLPHGAARELRGCLMTFFR